MSVKLLINRLELNFWHLVIPLIQRSPAVRFVLPHAYQLFTSEVIKGFILPACLYAAGGLLTGFIIGYISRFF
jgi:hypothetical protein